MKWQYLDNSAILITIYRNKMDDADKHSMIGGKKSIFSVGPKIELMDLIKVLTSLQLGAEFG